VEFTFFKTEGGRRLLSSDIVVGKEAGRVAEVSSSSRSRVSEAQFMESLDENGRPVFERLLARAKANGFPIHWGTKGFSMNVDLAGTHVTFCYGYPPHCVFKQSLYTALVGQGGLIGKIDASEGLTASLRADAQETGLFQPAGNEFKCVIDRALSEEEINRLISWCELTARTIKEHGLPE